MQQEQLSHQVTVFQYVPIILHESQVSVTLVLQRLNKGGDVNITPSLYNIK
jgi:hypothetical protein